MPPWGFVAEGNGMRIGEKVSILKYSYSELDASPRRTGAKSPEEQEEEKCNHEPRRSANMESRKVRGVGID